MKLLRTIPAFPVHRIDDAVKFYETKLGFTCLHKDNAFAILIRDNAEIHLWVSQAGARVPRVPDLGKE